MSHEHGMWITIPAAAALLATLWCGASEHAVSANPATPASGGYPYAGATCEFGAAGGPDCANPGDSGDRYDWGAGSAGQFQPSDQWGYEYRNCTSYVAWRLAQAGVSAALFRDLGDATKWLTGVAGEPGVAVSQVPSPGAVAVWVVSAGTGHVAWVDSVAGGRVIVSDYNYAGTGVFATHEVTVPPVGYIRFPRGKP
jgi:surface antigen